MKKNKTPAALAERKQRRKLAAKARRARRKSRFDAIVARRLLPLTKLVSALKTENDRLNRQLNFVPAPKAEEFPAGEQVALVDDAPQQQPEATA